MKRWSLLALATAGIAFSACNNSANTEGNGTSDTVIMDDTTFDTTTVGERLDNGIDSVKQAGREAKSDINAAAADAKAEDAEAEAPAPAEDGWFVRQLFPEAFEGDPVDRLTPPERYLLFG